MKNRTLSQTRSWILAARPRTLPAAIGPVLIGAALGFSAGAFHLLSVILSLVLALLLQILANIANDYFDHVHGVDSDDRVGPARAAASGLIPLNRMRVGIAIVVVLIIAAGLYPVLRAGFPAAILGTVAILSAFAYSAGPVPLSSKGLGDIFVFLFFGPAAVCGTFYLQALALPPAAIVASIPVGALVTAILVVNNHRDMETDRAAGKITLAVRLGRSGSRTEFLLLVGAAYGFTILLWRMFGSAWLLAPLVTLPLAVSVSRDIVGRATGAALNRTLARTAVLSLAHSLVLAAAIIVQAAY